MSTTVQGRPRIRPQSNGLRLAAEAVGGYKNLADMLGISEQAVSLWSSIPIKRVVQVEEVSGVPRKKLHVAFGAPPDPLPPKPKRKRKAKHK